MVLYGRTTKTKRKKFYLIIYNKEFNEDILLFYSLYLTDNAWYAVANVLLINAYDVNETLSFCI